MKTFLSQFQSAKIDDEIKSDVYTKSINNIVISNSPISISKVESLLEDNGYYGRFTVSRQTTKDYRDLRIKIKVYLPDSIFYYTWPFDTHFSLSNMNFGKRKKPRVIQNNIKLIRCMEYLYHKRYNISNNIEVIAEIGSLYMGWSTKEEYMQMIRFLIKAGLFKNGWFVIKSPQDLKEIYENLFDYSYFVSL